LTTIDEKNLSAAQPPTNTNPRIPGPHGNAGRPQNPQAQARKGTQPTRDQHPAEATSLGAGRSKKGFSAADRLRRGDEFRRVQRTGARFQTTHFVFYAQRIPGEERSRLGITVSRRVGNAVARNHVKRRVRECYRLKLRSILPTGASVVVIARAGAGELAMSAIEAELLSAAANVSNRLGG
jgi:ribonuclease P protein component